MESEKDGGDPEEVFVMKKMKQLLCVLLLLALAVGLVACGPGEDPVDPNTGTDSAVASGSETGKASDDKVSDGEKTDDSDDSDKVAAPNMFLACDQYNRQIVLYDLDKIEEGDDLEDALVWTLEDADYCADMKYREDTVFGDVILTTRGMYSYPSGEAIWICGNPGNNTHAVEILPDGDIVFANSTGGTVRYFNSSVLLDDPSANVQWKDHELYGAHGVVYDPEYETLWALGSKELVGYMVMEDGIKEIGGLGAMLPEKNQDGHDLSADYSDSRYLYLTSSTVLRFDKEECKFIKSFPQSNKLSNAATKGFGNNENNNFIFIVCNGKGNENKPWGGMNIADWCSDKVYYGYWQRDNYMKVAEFVTSTRAFYKTRPFIGTYQ